MSSFDPNIHDIKCLVEEEGISLHEAKSILKGRAITEAIQQAQRQRDFNILANVVRELVREVYP